MDWREYTPVATRFEGKVAIVTGSGRGIGQEYAGRLAREGASVCIADIRGEDAKQTAEEIHQLGGTAIAVTTDVSDEQSVKQMVEATVGEFGRLDYLINNAALYGDRHPWDILSDPMDYWDQSLAVNLTSVVHCTRAVVQPMEAVGGGAIVNQSSGAAFGAGVPQYVVTKMGVISLTFCFAKLLGAKNIRVNAIAPGLTDTEAYRHQVVDRGMEPQLLSQLALQRRGTPGDQAAAVLFLLSEEAGYITGQVLSVNGGLTMRA